MTSLGETNQETREESYWNLRKYPVCVCACYQLS